MMKQKAISLWQPWASLVMLGAKTFETRGRPTKYRGPLTIHAAKRWNRKLFRLCQIEPFKAIFASHLTDGVFVLPLGVALGTVELVDVVPTEAVRGRISKQERAFGDYDDGRFAWRLANPKPFPQPIPVLGRQGFFYIEFHCEQCQETVELLVRQRGKWLCEGCRSEMA